MIRETVKEERNSLLPGIYLFIKSKPPYSSINYIFIAKVARSEMIKKNYKDMSEQSTPQVNDDKPINPESLLNTKTLVKDAVVLLPHSLFWILSHRILPDSTPNGSDSTGRCVTSNCTIKICLVTLSIAKNDINAITIGKAVNELIKLIHTI